MDRTRVAEQGIKIRDCGNLSLLAGLEQNFSRNGIDKNDTNRAPGKDESTGLEIGRPEAPQFTPFSLAFTYLTEKKLVNVT